MFSYSFFWMNKKFSLCMHVNIYLLEFVKREKDEERISEY